jgi:hypothetical protein
MEPKFVTNAHEDYDYWYVRSLSEFVIKGVTWRVIEVADMERFNTYQLGRYGSGMKVAYPYESQEAQDLFKQIGE